MFRHSRHVFLCPFIDTERNAFLLVPLEKGFPDGMVAKLDSPANTFPERFFAVPVNRLDGRDKFNPQLNATQRFRQLLRGAIDFNRLGCTKVGPGEEIKADGFEKVKCSHTLKAPRDRAHFHAVNDKATSLESPFTGDTGKSILVANLPCQQTVFR